MLREWADLASLVSMYSVGVPVIILLLRQSYFNEIQRLIGKLVAITFFGECIIIALTVFEISNMPAVHLFTVLQFVFLVLVFGRGLSPLYSSKILKGVIIFFIVFAIVDATLINGIYNFNSFSRPLASFVLVFLALRFFYKTLIDLKLKSLVHEPLIWLGIGVILYFSGSLFIFLFTNYIKASNDALFTIWGIHAIFNIILNISYCIALWIRPAS